MSVVDLQHLQEMLQRLDEFIQDAVTRAEMAGQDPTDALRGFVIKPEDVAHDLQQSALTSLWTERGAVNWSLLAATDHQQSHLSFLFDVYQLTALDAALLLICLAPTIDSRYERLYAFLQDNIAQKRPTVTLAMNLLGGTVEQRYAVWERLQHHQPLRQHHLINTLPDPAQPQAPFLRHTLTLDDRLVGYALGDNTPDRRLTGIVNLVEAPANDPPLPTPQGTTTVDLQVIADLMPEAPLVYMYGPPDAGQVEAAAALCQTVNLPLLRIDAAALVAANVQLTTTPAANEDEENGWPLAIREGYLHGTALLIDNWAAVLDEEGLHLSNALWQRILNYPYPVFLVGNIEWESPDHWRPRPMLRLTYELPSYRQRLTTWESLISKHQAQVPAADLESLASHFRFTNKQIARAMNSALDRSRTRGEAPTSDDLYTGAQAQVALRFGRLARRITPRATWDDVVLPQDQVTQLREIIERAHYLPVVKSEWGFGERLNNLDGISALFSGESGTGKTLSAQLIARELALPLYKIDLSGVVSKYIGETEKNLHTIFEEARSSSAILFFDEADALFGKRSEVKDAHDRYANIETAYLLQKIEEYDGIAIMATNLRQNLDEAFTRRLDFLVDFPFPDAENRRQIWAVHFPPEAPLESSVSLQMLAERYRLAGGNIRNAVVAAAYLAAADGGTITLQHIQHAVRREYQKMGRLLDDMG